MNISYSEQACYIKDRSNEQMKMATDGRVEEYYQWESEVQSQLGEFAKREIKEREEMNLELDEGNKDFNENKMAYPTPYADFTMNVPNCGCRIQKDPGLIAAEKRLQDFNWGPVEARIGYCIPYEGLHPPCDEYYKNIVQQLTNSYVLLWTLLTCFERMSVDDFKKFQENYHKQIRQDSKGCDEQGNSDREKGSGEGNEVVNCGEGDSNY